MKNGKVLAFVALIDLLALGALIGLFPYHAPEYLIGLSLLASLSVMTGTGPVRIPSLKASVSVTDAFLLTALGALGPFPACLVAGAGVLGATFGKDRHRRPLHFAFNLGNVIVSTAVAAVAYLAVGGVPGAPVLDQIWPLLVATTIYFLLNTGLVAMAVLMDTSRSFFRTWKESSRWSAVSAYAGLTMSAFLLWAINAFGPSGLALGVPPLWLLAAFYRTHKERQVEAQNRIDVVEGANAELEDKVADRTRELQEALSHIHNANSRLRMANDRLKEANRAKSEFLANVSHELRTPLNAVIGFSDLLRDSNFGALNEQQSEFINDIHESGEHLLRLINDILDLSKIEAGKMEARLQVFDVPKVIQEAVSMLHPQATGKELSLSARCSPDVRAGRLDPGMFRQVLVNLLSNAVKFTPAHGSVEVYARREGKDLIVQVTDSGIGIPAADVNRVFDEFYQVDASYSRNYQGTGLGLALVRRMVTLQGGRISVESTPHVGSTFICHFADCLTEAPPEPVGPRTISRAVRSDGEGCTILLVEDNSVNRKLARNALRSQGYVVAEAKTGEEALNLLRSKQVDLVLMDLQLPGMDGLEVTRRLKADPRTAEIPVVALTAHAKQADELLAREAGCVGYITKPIRLAQFPSQVASYLPRREEPVEAATTVP